MKTIFKYPIEIERIGADAAGDATVMKNIIGLLEVLSITKQREDVVLYALVDTNSKKTSQIKVTVCGTGFPNTVNLDKMKYAGTLGFQEDSFMFHFFYEIVREFNNETFVKNKE